MPRFKIDENLPREVAGLLVEHGRDALTVHEQGHAGTSDAVLSEVCKAEERVIMTLDLDFSNIRAYPPEERPGIIVLRVEHQDKDSVLSAVTSMLPLLSVEPDRVRIWRCWE